tara:strand:- start:642 stop:1040 length:399 start_codon:yes stop_codon:yes gene_type:complete
MEVNKLKELISKCVAEILQEEGNTSSSAGGYLTKFAFKKSKTKQKSINEVRYSQFKNTSKTRTPQEQLHMGVKEMQRKLDEINKLVDFTTRMKNELKGDAEEMNLLKRTHNSLFKINEKIQEINNKIKDLTK